jgi:hypothetical protein
MARGAIPAMSCSATWPRLAVRPAIKCTKPDGGVVSSSDRKAVIALLTLSADELDLRAERWISADNWELWRAGMAARLSRWPFDMVWDEVRNRMTKERATHVRTPFQQPAHSPFRVTRHACPRKPAVSRAQ